ncbi:MAG: hypothetical protein AABW79_03505 [Nanoarchaeota archaeon]
MMNRADGKGLEALEFDHNTWRYAVAGLCAGASALIIASEPEYYNSEELKLAGIAMAGSASLVCSGTLIYRLWKALRYLENEIRKEQPYTPPKKTSNWNP